MSALAFAPVLAALFAGLALAGNPSFTPCEANKRELGFNTQGCTEVKLPADLCTSCKLRKPLANGKFRDCSNIYDTFNPQCLNAMERYVKANPCDKNRAQLLPKLRAKNVLNKYKYDLDYFVYSLCEECCDCIPMGAAKSDRGKWVTYRGNCAAHAWYDICMILPHVKNFITVGQKSQAAKYAKYEPMCTHLRRWTKTDQFPNWVKRAEIKIHPELSDQLATLLDATQCSKPSIWNECFDLESKQKNLGVPGQFKKQGRVGRGFVPLNQPKPKPPAPKPKPPAPKPNNKFSIAPFGVSVENCAGLIRWGCVNWVPPANGKKGFCRNNVHKCMCFPWLPKGNGPHISCLISGGIYRTKSSKSGFTHTPTGHTLNNCQGRIVFGCQRWVKGRGCVKNGCVCQHWLPFVKTPPACAK